jgi:hypothetical protein
MLPDGRGLRRNIPSLLDLRSAVRSSFRSERVRLLGVFLRLRGTPPKARCSPAAPRIEGHQLRGRNRLGQLRPQRHRRMLGESLEYQTEGASFRSR